MGERVGICINENSLFSFLSVYEISSPSAFVRFFIFFLFPPSQCRDGDDLQVPRAPLYFKGKKFIRAFDFILLPRTFLPGPPVIYCRSSASGSNFSFLSQVVINRLLNQKKGNSWGVTTVLTRTHTQILRGAEERLRHRRCIHLKPTQGNVSRGCRIPVPFPSERFFYD